MPDNMLAFLSSALDRREDVELTPEVLSQFMPAGPADRGEPTPTTAPGALAAAGNLSVPATPPPYQPTLTDNLLLAAIVLLIFVLIIVVVLLILSFA